MKPTPENIAVAARLLKDHNLVIFPSETVYGLGALASSDLAVKKIYLEKKRPSYNPLIVHVSSLAQAESLGVFSDDIKKVVNVFWPGPLTVVVPLREDAQISPIATAGLKTVALRFSKHKILLSLLDAVGEPLVAPSANPSGSLSSTCAEHIRKYFPHLPLVDGGQAEAGLESTVVTERNGVVHILRPGAISLEDIEQKTALPTVFAPKESSISSPGQLDRHYAPKLRLRMNAYEPLKGEAYLGFGKTKINCALNLSPLGSLEEAAANLFKYLHILDNPVRYTGIAVSPIPDEGLGVSINDRLQRASKASFS